MRGFLCWSRVGAVMNGKELNALGHYELRMMENMLGHAVLTLFFSLNEIFRSQAVILLFSFIFLDSGSHDYQSEIHKFGYYC